MTHELYPCLWFDGTAKEAAGLYLAAFKNSNITTDTPLVVTFELDGQKFMGLNGGPTFTPNPSISFYVVCETKSELEQAWNSLSEEGKVLMPLDAYPWSEQYGWVQDKFGISWQLALDKLENVGQKFTPSMMFTGQQVGKAEEAIRFYTGIFADSSVVGILKYDALDQDVEGRVKHAQFKLKQQVFMAMDSSYPHGFGFNEGISLVVPCDTQAEIDYYWDKLSQGGQEG